jgi:hypothetical protein
MRTTQDENYISLTVPESVIRTNQKQTKTERFRNRKGLPTLRDISDATAILNRMQTADGLMELSRPENIDLLRWAHNVVNYECN